MTIKRYSYTLKQSVRDIPIVMKISSKLYILRDTKQCYNEFFVNKLYAIAIGILVMKRDVTRFYHFRCETGIK